MNDGAIERTKVEKQDMVCGACFSDMPLYSDADGWIHVCDGCGEEWVPQQCGTRRGYQQDGLMGGSIFPVIGSVFFLLCVLGIFAMLGLIIWDHYAR